MPSNSASGPRRWAGTEPKAIGAIITEVPTIRQRAVRSGEPGLQPVELCAAGDGALRVVDHVAVADVRLLVAEGAQIEQMQIGEAAEAQPPVGGALGRGPYGHPLEVRLLRGPYALRPVALLAGRVVLGAPGPGVVGELVVVPHRDQRVCRVHGLEVGIELVVAVPDAVVGERGDLVLGL